ncbi:MipA/OmpV family protein [Eikenella corrodens]|nr:MipA/OmpV family protein [Eikenella corrodens]
MKHIVRTGVLFSLSMCLLHAPSAYAEDFRQEPQKTEFSVGVAGGYADSGYRGKSADWTVAPLVQLETKRFYIRGLSAGVKLYTSADQSQKVLLGGDLPARLRLETGRFGRCAPEAARPPQKRGDGGYFLQPVQPLRQSGNACVA